MNDDSSSEGGQPQRRDPFAVDVERALDVLVEAWTDYDQIWFGHDGKWGAHRSGAGDDDVITAATPDELCRALFADSMRRRTQ